MLVRGETCSVIVAKWALLLHANMKGGKTKDDTIVSEAKMMH